MNMAPTFHGARPVARHCPELTERGPRPEERAEFLAIWRRDVAREVAQDISALLSGARIAASLSEPEPMPGAAAFARIGPVAANSLLRCGAGDHTALLSFSVETAIALTDRSFGGTGELPDQPVDSLPRSAALLVEQVARTIAAAIARVSAGGGATGEIEGDVIIRSENAARLKPFAPSARCALMRIDLADADGACWSATLAMTAERLDALLPGLGSPPPVRAEEDPDARRAAAAAAFGPMLLPLHAVLAEFELSLGQLERLGPGDEIPIAIARDIPLRIGSQLVGRGRLGTIEDRMALRLGSTPSEPGAEAQGREGGAA